VCALCKADPGSTDPAVAALLLFTSLNITERLMDDTIMRLGEARSGEPGGDADQIIPRLLRAAVAVILARAQADAVPPVVRETLAAWAAEAGAVPPVPWPGAGEEEPAVTAALVGIAIEVILDRAEDAAPEVHAVTGPWADTLTRHDPPQAEPGSLTWAAAFLAGRTL
jgi:hypothetical protein